MSGQPQPSPHVRPSLCAKLIWKMSCASYGKPSVITVGQNMLGGAYIVTRKLPERQSNRLHVGPDRL
jgi:hypothetical protein